MIRGITTCLLCDKEFTGPLYTLIGQGKQGQAEVINYLKEVQTHFVERHSQENEAIQNRSLEFLAMLRLLNFRSTDSKFLDQVQFLRWQINQQTIPIRFADQKLEAMAGQQADELTAMVLEEASRVLGPATMKMLPDASLKTLQINIRRKFQERTATIVRELRDLYEEPGKYDIEVIEVPKPGKSPDKPLLVLPNS